MAVISKRAMVTWVLIAALLLAQVAWAGAQSRPGHGPVQPELNGHAPAGGHETLWVQEPTATYPLAYIAQDFGIQDQSDDTYIADDFATSHLWEIDTIFVPGDTWADVGTCDLTCADSLNWVIYPDAGGEPKGVPSSSTPAPVWSITLLPNDSQVTKSTGPGGNLSNVLLELSTPFLVGPGTWWLVFYPTMSLKPCSCRYGWRPSDTTDLFHAQVVNPGGGLFLPTTWTSIRAGSTFSSDEQNMAFRLEGFQSPWLGDLVWYDTDQDGIQDTGEPGVSGIGVDWYDNPDCTGVSRSRAWSDSSGIYTFAAADTGKQCLQFFDIPKGWSISPQNQGVDDTHDSDAIPDLAQIRDIDLQKDDTDYDVGLFVEGSISGRLWCDADCDRQFDSGEELAGATVELLRDHNCKGGLALLEDREVTNASGQYSFTGLYAGPPGDPVCYNVEVDETTAGKCTQPLLTLSRQGIELDANHPTDTGNDFGLSEGLRIGGRVWYDPDQDGIQDAGEVGLEKMTAHLHADAKCTGASFQTETTDAGGHYCFDGLPADTYCVQFKVPTGWQITAQNQGSDDKVDSDASPSSGQIGSINLTADRLYESMGVYARGAIGGHVYCDTNHDDDYDAGEGIKDAVVSRYDDTDCDGTGDGTPSDVTTGADGAYFFGQLMVGTPADPACSAVYVDEATVGTCDTPVTPTGWGVKLDTDFPSELNIDFGFRHTVVLDERIYLPLAVHNNQ